MDGPTLDDLRDELNRGRVYECSLRDERWVIDGLTDGDSIWIDPRPGILDTLVHELIHRRKPRWGETSVRRHTAKLIASMDEATMKRWWRAYRRTVKKRRPVELEE